MHLFLDLTKYHDKGDIVYTFLTLPLDGSEWSGSGSGYFAPRTYRIGYWVSLRVSVGRL